MIKIFVKITKYFVEQIGDVSLSNNIDTSIANFD